MRFSTMNRLAATWASCLTLITVAGAQWPFRYDYDAMDDGATAVAVDKRGNVYVCGNVTTENEGINVVVSSYTASGSLRSGWPRTYNGVADGDDYATSIAVDNDCNVYVAGTSWGDSTDYDFFVWKLNTDGQAVWPTSGSYTGYNFDSLGAVRPTRPSTRVSRLASVWNLLAF